MVGKRILILGGTADAVELARRLDGMAGIEVLSSMAGVTSNPRRPAGLVRSGGFGGIAGLVDYLGAERIDAVLDATHPFAVQISRHAAQAGRMTGKPVLHLVRPAWRRQVGDTWHGVASANAAADWLERSALPAGVTVFLTLGRAEIAAFAGAPRFRYLVRSIEPPPDIERLADAELLLARGPFSLENERGLLRRHDVACLVAKNSGGEAMHAKIQAARDLGKPVLMIRQPPPPADAETVASIDDAVGWTEKRIGIGLESA